MRNIDSIYFSENVKLTSNGQSTSWIIEYHVIDEDSKLMEDHKLRFMDRDEAMRVYSNLQTSMEAQKPNIIKIGCKEKSDTYMFYGNIWIKFVLERKKITGVYP